MDNTVTLLPKGKQITMEDLNRLLRDVPDDYVITASYVEFWWGGRSRIEINNNTGEVCIYWR